MEILGLFSFFGVLLLDAQSTKMEMAMCQITVFSLSMLCFVLADLDSPFNGFFRVDSCIIQDVIYRLKKTYEFVEQTGNVNDYYPTKP